MNEKTPAWPVRVAFDRPMEEAWYLLYYTVLSGVSSALLVRVATGFDVTVFYEMQGERRPYIPFERDTCTLIDAALTDFQHEMEREHDEGGHSQSMGATT